MTTSTEFVESISTIEDTPLNTLAIYTTPLMTPLSGNCSVCQEWCRYIRRQSRPIQHPRVSPNVVSPEIANNVLKRPLLLPRLCSVAISTTVSVKTAHLNLHISGEDMKLQQGCLEMRRCGAALEADRVSAVCRNPQFQQPPNAFRHEAADRARLLGCCLSLQRYCQTCLLSTTSQRP